MTQDYLPAVLQGVGRNSSISMERALKQILKLLENHIDDIEWLANPSFQDRVLASIDDLKTMLEQIK